MAVTLYLDLVLLQLDSLFVMSTLELYSLDSKASRNNRLYTNYTSQLHINQKELFMCNNSPYDSKLQTTE